MRRYGFNRKPLIDLPRDEMRASGVYDRNGELLRRLRRGRHRPCRDRPGAPPGDAAPDGDGAAAIANGGSLMRPHLVREVRDRDGRDGAAGSSRASRAR